MDEQNHLPKYIEHKDADSAVLFIHGFMGGPRQFDRLSQLVYDHGFSASCVLLPGHGVSLKDFSSSTYRSWIKSVSEELDRLEKKYKSLCRLKLSACIRIPHHPSRTTP
jgi:carboxylesterase